MEGAPAPSNTEAPPLDAAALLRTLGPAITPATAAQINAAPENQRAGLILGSPDFMKR